MTPMDILTWMSAVAGSQGLVMLIRGEIVCLGMSKPVGYPISNSKLQNHTNK